MLFRNAYENSAFQRLWRSCLVDRTNVEMVIVAGKICKWKGRLLGVDLNNRRRQLENSRDYIFSAAKIPQNPFGSQ